jgi:hypothetical protein
MTNQPVKKSCEPKNPGFRFYFGTFLFVVSFFMLPTGLFLQQFSHEHFWRAFILSVFWAGAPVLKITSVAVLGKCSYIWIRYKFWHLFVKAIKADKVSRTRYTIGLIMFCLPIIPNYIMAYAPRFITDAYHWRLLINVAIDTIFIASIFILGGDFWDKLRALFTFTARAKFIDAHPAGSPGK